MNVTDALLEWTTYRAKLCTLGLVAKSTLENQSAIAARLMDGFGSVPLADLRKSHIELWMGERLRNCAPVTVRGEMNVLRQVLNWCVDEQMLATKPRLPALSVPTTEDALPADEAFAWFLRTMPATHSDALQFMMLTGLSPHELERLQARDISPAGEVLIGMRDDFAVKQPSRRRPVPMNPAARAIWFTAAAGLLPDAHPFPGVDAMQRAMRRHVLSRMQDTPAGAVGLTPKMMRKWFASKVAVEHGEAVLQRLLGHAPGSPITRRHYVRSNDRQLVDAVTGIAP